MAKEHIIMWQKWADPFGGDDIDDMDQEPVFDDSDNEEEDLEEDEMPNQDMFKKMMAKGHTPIKVMATPMGIIPVNENTASGKIFNFWVGHTNFNITKHLAGVIENIDGVETLDIFTRYRFRVGIGKAFIDSDVMRDINSKVYEILDNVE